MNRRSITSLVAVATLAVLCSCGTEKASAPETSASGIDAQPTSTDAPQCSALVGVTVPEKFTGCQSNGHFYSADIHECEDGSVLVVSGVVIGFVGKKMRALDEGAKNHQELLACVGDF